MPYSTCGADGSRTRSGPRLSAASGVRADVADTRRSVFCDNGQWIAPPGATLAAATATSGYTDDSPEVHGA